MVLVYLKFASAVIYFAVDFKYIRIILNFCLSSTFLLFALSREDFVILFLPPGCHFMGRPARLPDLCFARPAPPVHTCTRAWTDALASSGCYTCSWDTTYEDFLFTGNISILHASEMGAGPQKYFCTMFRKPIKHSF